MRPSELTDHRGVVMVVGLLVLLALGLLAAWGVTNVLGCGPGEREIFAQFPQYAGKTTEPESEPGLGICAASFATPAPQGKVYAYYEERLRERGWGVEVQEPPPRSTEPAALVGRRGGYRYEVFYEPEVRLPGGRRVTVIVSG